MQDLLAQLSPLERIAHILQLHHRPFVSTSFGKYSAAMLHLATEARPNIPVLWTDTGYVNAETYAFKDHLVQALNLNLLVAKAEGERPEISRSMHLQQPVAFYELSTRFKAKPFREAIERHGFDVWIAGVMHDETPERQKADIYTSGKLAKLCPTLPWSEQDCIAYIKKHGLPMNCQYTDVFKPDPKKECSLDDMYNSMKGAEL